MSTFNWVLLLWQISFGISAITCSYGIFTRSWISVLVSAITFLPVAYYFLGAENAWRLVGLIPVSLLILSFAFWRKKE